MYTVGTRDEHAPVVESRRSSAQRPRAVAARVGDHVTRHTDR